MLPDGLDPPPTFRFTAQVTSRARNHQQGGLGWSNSSTLETTRKAGAQERPARVTRERRIGHTAGLSKVPVLMRSTEPHGRKPHSSHRRRGAPAPRPSSPSILPVHPPRPLPRPRPRSSRRPRPRPRSARRPRPMRPRPRAHPCATTATLWSVPVPARQTETGSESRHPPRARTSAKKTPSELCAFLGDLGRHVGRVLAERSSPQCHAGGGAGAMRRLATYV